MKKKVKINLCPNCDGHIFRYDEYHKEQYCYSCGLVINAPYTADFIRPDFKTIIITLHIPETVEIVKKR